VNGCPEKDRATDDLGGFGSKDARRDTVTGASSSLVLTLSVVKVVSDERLNTNGLLTCSQVPERPVYTLLIESSERSAILICERAAVRGSIAADRAPSPDGEESSAVAGRCGWRWSW